MEETLLTTLTELGSTAFIQLLLGIVIYLAITKYLPRVAQEHKEQIENQRTDFMTQLDKLENNRHEAVIAFQKTIDDLETAVEKNEKSLGKLVSIIISTQTTSAEESQKLLEKVLNGD
tara:strand:+ start:1965 stop:2318 length:354 start_codon:yes stop_codon:yes gene_type:complete